MCKHSCLFSEADLRRLAGNAFAGSCVLAMLHIIFGKITFCSGDDDAVQDLIEQITK